MTKAKNTVCNKIKTKRQENCVLFKVLHVKKHNTVLNKELLCLYNVLDSELIKVYDVFYFIDQRENFL